MSWKSVRMAGPAQVSNAAATKYTVPAGTVARIRWIQVSNPGPLAATFTMSIGADAAATRIYDAYSIPAPAAGQPASVYTIGCFHVLNAAEVVQALSGTNNQLVLTFSGEESIAGY